MLEDADGWCAAMYFGETPIEQSFSADPASAAEALAQIYTDKISVKKKP